MKKIFLMILLFLSFLNISYADTWDKISTYDKCKYNDWDSVVKLLDWCKPQKVVSSTDMKLETWFKKKVNWFITNLMVVLWIIAVWAIVYAWWLMQFSAWEDEQINKAKNIIKWTIIWFLLLISASWIVYIVINVMFWLWWD